MVVNKKHIRIAGCITALATIASKWFFGVLIRKLIDLSFSKNAGSSGVPSDDSTPLLAFVFLENLSFETVAIGAAVFTILLGVSSAAVASMSLLLASRNGRKLRRQILEAAVGSRQGGSSPSAAGEKNHIANELLVKVKIIEDFQAFDEQLLLVHMMIFSLAFILVFVFSWYGGLLALALFLFGQVTVVCLESRREKPAAIIDTNREQVHMRLLDVVRNGTQIKIMGTSEKESKEMDSVESESDQPRLTDAKLKFLRDAGNNTAVTAIPILMALVAWVVIQNEDSANAINTGFAILVALLLLDEAHKSLIYLNFIYEKKAQVDRAMDSVLSFTGASKITSPSGEMAGKAEDQDKSNASTDIEEAKEAANSDGQWDVTADPNATTVSLEHISLKYPGSSYYVLDNYSRTFERGKIHGLIGESGSGKSTCLKVLAGLLEPGHGTLRVWQGMKTAYISQDENLFTRTIREIVSYGSDEEIDSTDVWAALERARLSDWVASLPRGLDEKLQGGEANVSGGQRQRLHLAHLFCTCQSADMVLLDECLSALDAKSRELLIDELQQFLQGKTAFIVTHHLELLRICDVVHDLTPRSTSQLRQQRPSQVPIPRRSSEIPTLSVLFAEGRDLHWLEED